MLSITKIRSEPKVNESLQYLGDTEFLFQCSMYRIDESRLFIVNNFFFFPMCDLYSR